MSKTESKTTAVIDEVAELCAGSIEANPGLAKGLANLKKVRVYPEASWPAMPFTEFTLGSMAFRSAWGEGVKIEVGCGQAQQRQISLQHFVALVEGMGKKEEGCVLLQNFSERDDRQSARGQILARLDPEYSAIVVWQGLAGRVISSHSDIALQDIYYIHRDNLVAMYLGSKFQIGNNKVLDELAAANGGWKKFNIPLDPKRPYDARL